MIIHLKKGKKSVNGESICTQIRIQTIMSLPQIQTVKENGVGWELPLHLNKLDPALKHMHSFSINTRGLRSQQLRRTQWVSGLLIITCRNEIYWLNSTSYFPATGVYEEGGWMVETKTYVLWVSCANFLSRTGQHQVIRWYDKQVYTPQKTFHLQVSDEILRVRYSE